MSYPVARCSADVFTASSRGCGQLDDPLAISGWRIVADHMLTLSGPLFQSTVYACAVFNEEKNGSTFLVFTLK